MALCGHCITCGHKFSCGPTRSCGDCDQPETKVVELWRRRPDGDDFIPEPIFVGDPTPSPFAEPKRICHGCVEMLESGALPALIEALKVSRR